MLVVTDLSDRRFAVHFFQTYFGSLTKYENEAHTCYIDLMCTSMGYFPSRSAQTQNTQTPMTPSPACSTSLVFVWFVVMSAYRTGFNTVCAYHLEALLLLPSSSWRACQQRILHTYTNALFLFLCFRWKTRICTICWWSRDNLCSNEAQSRQRAAAAWVVLPPCSVREVSGHKSQPNICIHVCACAWLFCHKMVFVHVG